MLKCALNRVGIYGFSNYITKNDKLLNKNLIKYFNYSRNFGNQPKISAKKWLFYPIIASLGVGASVLYSYTITTKRTLAFEADEVKFALNHTPKVTKRIRSITDNSNLKLTLYQYQSCPFCCKVRAYLDFRGLSYDVVEVNSVTQKEIKWSPYKKVPILTCQLGDKEVQLNDSSVIISCLETFFIDKENQSIEQVASFYPAYEARNSRGKMVMQFENRYSIMYGNEKKVPEDQQDVQKWREWTDNVLVHRISPNIYRSPSEAYKTFQVFSKVGEWNEIFGHMQSNFIIVIGSAAMYFIGKILKKRHKLSDDVRESLYDACNDWCRLIHLDRKSSKDNKYKKESIFNKELKSNKDTKHKEGIFYGGKEPNLADLSVYGVLNAMEGTDAFHDLIQNTPISKWFYAVKSEINLRAGKMLKKDDKDEYIHSGVGSRGKVGSSTG